MPLLSDNITLARQVAIEACGAVRQQSVGVSESTLNCSLRLRIAAVIGFAGLTVALQAARAQDIPEGDGAEEADSKAAALVSADKTEDRQKLVTFLREAYAKPPTEWPAPELDPGRPLNELAALTAEPIAPPDNPTTKEKARLGLSLFFDVRLSGRQQIACVSCHEPQLGWSNGVSLSFGVGRKQLLRHPPTLVGAGYHPALFSDGRASSLEEQAAMVIANPDEMGGRAPEIVQRLQAESKYYGPLFKAAFGDEEVSFPRVVQALAAFERSIRAGRTRFDKFAQGKADALNDSELAGLHLFRTKARCLNCHSGPMFTDEEFHNLGLTYYGRRFEDLGRYRETQRPEDVGAFRTPTLRNIDRTAPYMHNGIFPTMEGVLRLYNAGMPRPKPKENQKADPLFPKTSELLKPLKLTAEELGDLRAFLGTLSEPPTRVIIPPVPSLDQEPLEPDVASEKPPSRE